MTADDIARWVAWAVWQTVLFMAGVFVIVGLSLK
jgi:hypothetical protein